MQYKYKWTYICSPYKGNIEQNIQNAKVYCRKAIEMGFLPIAPHLYFTQFLDDNNLEERKLAFRYNEDLISICEYFCICGEQVSEGMKIEMDLASKLGKEILYISL